MHTQNCCFVTCSFLPPISPIWWLASGHHRKRCCMIIRHLELLSQPSGVTLLWLLLVEIRSSVCQACQVGSSGAPPHPSPLFPGCPSCCLYAINGVIKSLMSYLVQGEAAGVWWGCLLRQVHSHWIPHNDMRVLSLKSTCGLVID